MMDEQIYLSNLYDYYKDLLTDLQKRYFEDYYFDNLTMEEIANNFSVTKNAISKALKEVKEKLEYYESKLKLYHNRLMIEKLLDNDTFGKIEKYI